MTSKCDSCSWDHFVGHNSGARHRRESRSVSGPVHGADQLADKFCDVDVIEALPTVYRPARERNPYVAPFHCGVV